MEKLEVEYIKTADIEKYKNNPRKNDKAVEIVKKSIKEFGFINPVLINKEGVLLAGHTRLEAAKSLNLEEIPAIYVENLSLEQQAAFRIMDNKSQEYAKWDDDLLKLEMNFLKDMNFDLKLTGFKEPELNKLIPTELKEKPIDVKKQKYDVKNGDIYGLSPYIERNGQKDVEIIGNTVRIKETNEIIEIDQKEIKFKHKLMCADSTDDKQISQLMKDEKARMVFTDPPYGVSYKGTNNPNGREWEVIEGDNLRGDALYQLIYKSSKLMHKYTIENPALYVFYASVNHTIFEKALNDAGFKIKQQLIWDKHHVLGHSDYHWNHEPILYCIKNDKNCEWFGDRTNQTILERTNKEFNEMKKEELIEYLNRMKENSTIWTIKKDSSVYYIHPTQKPYQIAQKAIINSSKENEIIFEPFAGSGSTLIACHLLNRRCRAVEMDPKYASAILERYENLTKTKPILIKSGNKEYYSN